MGVSARVDGGREGEEEGRVLSPGARGSREGRGRRAWLPPLVDTCRRCSGVLVFLTSTPPSLTHSVAPFFFFAAVAAPFPASPPSALGLRSRFPSPRRRGLRQNRPCAPPPCSARADTSDRLRRRCRRCCTLLGGSFRRGFGRSSCACYVSGGMG